jgi:hypothetical protein
MVTEVLGLRWKAGARDSEREPLVLFDKDCSRLLGTENANGSRVDWNSAITGSEKMRFDQQIFLE